MLTKAAAKRMEKSLLSRARSSEKEKCLQNCRLTSGTKKHQM